MNLNGFRLHDSSLLPSSFQYIQQPLENLVMSSETKSMNLKRKESDLHEEEQPVKRTRILDDSDEEKTECGCRKGCSKRSCPCFKSPPLRKSTFSTKSRFFVFDVGE